MFHLCCSIIICCHWCAYTHFIWSPLHISKTSKRILLPTNFAYVPKYISRPFQWQPKSATRLSYPPPHFCILYIWCIVRHEMVHVQTKNGFATTMQSVPTTTEFVSLNPAHDELYSIQQNVVRFIRVLRQIVGFPCVLWFPPPLKLTGTI